MKIDDIKKVLIVGAGTMGQQIAFQCAICGYDVVIYDISDEIVNNAMTRIQRIADGFVSKKRLSQEKAGAAYNRITPISNLEKAENIDIVSESVPEDPSLKIKIFSKLNEVCKVHTIFTTNTSTLLPSQIAEGTGRPEKFAALHFHDVRISRIVDVMPHPGTSAETTDLVYTFAKRIGQIPILLKKEHNGYVYNTMLVSIIESALSLAVKDVASIEDIDRSWIGIMHTQIGPFGIMDQIGLGTVWKVVEYWGKVKNDPERLKLAEFVKGYVDKNHLGKKTGQGFYTYPNPSYRDPQFLEGEL